MARYPREEIDYKKLYKKVDLDRDLGIDWPEVEQLHNIVVINEIEQGVTEEFIYDLDEYDEEFCMENGIALPFYIQVVKKLEKNYIEKVFASIDSIVTKTECKFCDICAKENNAEDNRLIVCQGCYISVHESCYGTFEKSNDRWLCKKCIFYFEDGNCMFCNKTGGILKKTEFNSWAHVVCAMLNPSLSFCNVNTKDPIEVIDVVKIIGVCSICNEYGEYLIKCSYEDCNVIYHASCCAEVLYCDLNNEITYCRDHNPLEHANKILSKRNFINCIHGYPEISNNISIRDNKKFSKQEFSKFLQVVNQQPEVDTKGLESVTDTNYLEIIGNFWQKKKKLFGFYFQNIFIFSNRFLAQKDVK